MKVPQNVVPMTDQTVSTRIKTQLGDELMFQHYFVRDRCEPAVAGFRFEGLDEAAPAPGFLAALSSCDTVIICPSNPFVSVDPILSLPGVIEALGGRNVPVVVVSNIVGGEALKGPAAKMMQELDMPTSALGVAKHYVEKYSGLITGFVLDYADAELERSVEDLGLSTIVTGTVMITLEDKISWAEKFWGSPKHPDYRPMTITAVIPVKQLANAKQRLSSFLSASDRAALFSAMVRDVLTAVEACSLIDQIMVVTNDLEVSELGKGIRREDPPRAAASRPDRISNGGCQRSFACGRVDNGFFTR